MDFNRVVFFCKRKVKVMEVDIEERFKEFVWKFYVLNDLEVEVSFLEKKGNILF